MTNAAKISVIMSVYNGEKFLREAVDSILNQTYTNFEFLIIEDASTDKTLEILEEYKRRDSRIIIINKEKNKGPSGFIQNLNIGLQKATGKYIARMDADDISVTERFQKQIDFLEKNKEIFLVGSQVQCVNEHNENTKLLRAPLNNIEIQKRMFKNISLFHPVIMFRNSTDLLYREKMLYCEDYDFYFRLMIQKYQFENIEEPLLRYRILGDSISRKDKKLIKWLFVEKARQFFQEQKKSGSDSYDLFEPENILKILDIDFGSKAEDLLFASHVALKYQQYEDLTIILDKAKNSYPTDTRFNIYKNYLKIPKSILPYILKLTLK